jgi:hypothetical protein
MNIRIVKCPGGQAPADVRQAWVGLSLPVLSLPPGAIPWREMGILSGSRSLLGLWLKGRIQSIKLIKSPTSPGPRMPGYRVDPAVAVNLLEKTNPEAAAWWRTNASHLFRPGICFLFDEACCVVEGQDSEGLR